MFYYLNEKIYIYTKLKKQWCRQKRLIQSKHSRIIMKVPSPLPNLIIVVEFEQLKITLKWGTSERNWKLAVWIACIRGCHLWLTVKCRRKLKEVGNYNQPSGSTSLEILMASDVARSVLAAVTASMMEFGFCMYFKISVRICTSMSNGWSPTGI